MFTDKTLAIRLCAILEATRFWNGCSPDVVAFSRYDFTSTPSWRA